MDRLSPWAGGGARIKVLTAYAFGLAEAGEGRTLVGRYEPGLTGSLVLMRPYPTRWRRRQRRRDVQTLKSIPEGDGPE